jgi:hypothetical protein
VQISRGSIFRRLKRQPISIARRLETRQFPISIGARIRDGTAASAKAAESAALSVPLAEASWSYAQKAGAI